MKQTSLYFYGDRGEVYFMAYDERQGRWLLSNGQDGFVPVRENEFFAILDELYKKGINVHKDI